MAHSANAVRYRSLLCGLGFAALILIVEPRRNFADDPAVPDEGESADSEEVVQTAVEDAVVPFWRLEPGQTFSTTSGIRRETELQVGDHVESSDETVEIQMAYGVSVPDRDGGFRVGMRVQSMRRETNGRDDASNQLEISPKRDLAEMAMTFRISDDGEEVSSNHDELLVAARDPVARELLNRICGPDVFRSWIDVPFRIPVITNHQQLNPPPILLQRKSDEPDSEDDEAVPEDPKMPGLRVGRKWTRQQHVSLGLLGTMRMDCEYRVDSIDADTATITVQGGASIEPLVAPVRSMLTVESIEIATTEISGSGTVSMTEHSGVPESIRFEQKIALEGTGVVRSGKQTHEVRIKQSLTQNWIVSEFNHRDEPQGVPIQGFAR